MRISHPIAHLTLSLLALALAIGGPMSSAASTAEPWTIQASAAEPQRSLTEDSRDGERLLFSDDFEAFGDSSRWHRDHPFTVQSEIVTNGAFAARFSNEGGTPEYGQKRLEAAQSVVFVRVAFRVSNVGIHPATILQLRATDSTPMITIRVMPDGMLGYVTGATDIVSTSTHAAMPDEWHRLQVMVDTSRVQNNVRLWLDETELTTMRQDAWLGPDEVQILQLGDNTTGRISDIAIDDVLLDDTFIPATRAADPVAGTLTVRTSVQWAGVTFELDGREFRTDSTGVARIDVPRWSTDLRSRIHVHDATQGDFVASFSGWHDWISPQTKDVLAAFSLWKPVTFTFVDMYNEPVDPTLIDQLTIKSSIGEIYRLNPIDLAAPVLLISSVVTSPSGLHAKPITYYVDEVLIDGANVVNRSQQRTTFDTSPNWSISLLFYGVRFTAADALFGTPLGEEIVVRAPDGTEHRLALDHAGTVTIPRLPRGDYEVSVGGGGYSPPRPIRISRDQSVQLEVISQRDAMVFGAVVLSVVAGLVLAGRPFIVTAPVTFIRNAVGHSRRTLTGGRVR